MAEDDFSPIGTFRFFLEARRSPSWMSAPNSSGFFGILIGTMGDEAIESWTIASRMHLILDEESPTDALPVIGEDRKLVRYPLESDDQHRGRLYNAWDIYDLGGTEYVIEHQLRAAGYGPTSFIDTWGQSGLTWGQSGFQWGNLGAFVQFRYNAYGPRGEPPPYRTQFWVVFKAGFHPVTNDMTPWGEFDWGDSDDGVWSYVGYTDEFLKTVLGLIYKWKPSDHVFRGFRFETGGIQRWGQAGYTWGQSGITWGNGINVDVVLGVTIS